VTSSVNVPPVVVEQPQQPNQLDLLRILNQLQQGIGTGIAGANIMTQPLQLVPQVLPIPTPTPTPTPPPQSSISPQESHAVAQINDVIVPIPIDVNVVPSVSPSGSIRSTSSLPLGSIQTDNSGNQIVNT